MTYEIVEKPPSIFDFTPQEPIDDDNDLIEIVLSNGDVLYGRRNKSMSHWILDPELTPPKISLIGAELGAKAFRIKICEIGTQLFIKTAGLPDHLFYCMTSEGTVVSIQGIQRSDQLKASTLDYELSSR